MGVIFMKTHFIKSLFIITLLTFFAMPLKTALAVPAWLAPAALEVIKELAIDTALDVVQDFFKGTVKPEEVAQLKQRVAKLDAQLADYLKENNAQPTREFNELKTMVSKLDSLVNAMNNRLTTIEGKMDAVESKVDSFESRLANLETALADVGELRKLLLNIPQKQGVTSDKLSPVDFKVTAIYRSQGKGNFKELAEGSVLKSGDHYKIIFTPAEDCYVYVFQMDSSNALFQLFPLKAFAGVTLNHESPVKAGETYFIPASDKSFFLDEKTGTETIYFMVTRQKDIVIEQEYQAMLLAQQQNQFAQAQKMQVALIQAAKSVRERKGIGGVKSDVPDVMTLDDGEQFSLLHSALNDMCNGCVSVLSFEHE